MSGSPGEMGNILRQAQRMQQEFERARAELREQRHEGRGGGGAVKVVADGEGMVLSVSLRPGIPAESAVIEEMVLAAVREALTRAARARAERLERASGGIPLPWNF